MAKLIESKIIAWCAMILVVALIVFSFLLHTPWWGFCAIFFLFLGVFSHMVSLYLSKINNLIGRKLETCAFVCLILAIIGFIVEYILFNISFEL